MDKVLLHGMRQQPTVTLAPIMLHLLYHLIVAVP